MSTVTPAQPNASATLKYGMKINLAAKSLCGVDPKATYWLTNYEKHDLVALHSQPALTFTLVSTSSTSQDVCYGDRVILVDERGLVMNGQDTNTWGKGYITLKERKVQGELHFIFTRPSQPLIKGSPILLADVQTGNKVHIHAVSARGSSNQPSTNQALVTASTKHALTAERKSSSSCLGGYLRYGGHGHGQLIGFDIRVVSPTSAPTIPATPTVQNSTITPTNALNNDDEEAAVTTTNEQYSATSSESVNPPRPYNPDPYDIKEEVKPLRYGDKIRLLAKSPYYAGEGGNVGLYRKHDLIGVAPVISSKTGKPMEENDNDYEGEFVVSEYTICATGSASTGDIVRYSSTVVLIDSKNGNAVWNCRDTDTWTNGYIAEGPIVQNSMPPQPGTDGPQLVSSNFNHITQQGKLPTGQVHISFQPDSPSLFGFPIYNKDSNIFIDVEDTHQRKGKMNCRLSVYKKKSSMLCGGYLICLPNVGKPVSFTIERTAAVPIQRNQTIFVNKLMMKTNPNLATPPIIQETTTHYRFSTEFSKKVWFSDRVKYLSTFCTLFLTYLTVAYYIESHALPVTEPTDEKFPFLFGLITCDTFKQYLYAKQLFYMILTLISALLTMYANTYNVTEHHNHPQFNESVTAQQLNKELTLAQQQALWRVKHGEFVAVTVERNTLQHLIADAQLDGKGRNDPNAWMVEAGLDPDNIVVPERYINAEKGDIAKGKKRFIVTAKWRWINQLDTILDRPHPLFRIIKKNTVQFFCGKDNKGNCVYYEAPKAANLPEMDKLSVSIEELLFHFVYITEFLYQRLDNRLDARCVSVVDLNGIGLSDFGGKVVEFVQAVSKVTQQHYPERSAGILCVNAGFAFRAIWAMVAPMMDPVTRSKTHLWGGNFVQQMSAIIPMDNIPEMFGGTCKFTAKIPAAGPMLPAHAIEEKFNAITVAPLSTEEEQMFQIADTANQKYAAENTDLIPRPTLKG